MSKCLTQETVIIFLLECPPLEEIGGSVLNVIESYRGNVISKEKAINIILTFHKKYIEKYLINSIEINKHWEN